MSPEWRPDDSLSKRVGRREIEGTRRFKAALAAGRVSVADRIITSRDKKISDVQKKLKRPATDLPKGVQHWQMPVALGRQEDVLCFMSRMKPRTQVPEHAHKVSVFRVVIQGTLKSNGVTLGPGDWMLVPPGRPYSVQAGPTGCVTYYAHFSPPAPPAPPRPKTNR